jgi:hypothetical protein
MFGKLSRFNFLVLLFINIATYGFANTKPSYNYIFAKSSAGDRCHSALNSYLNKNALEDEKIFFCKSSKEAIKLAAYQKDAVFLKLLSIPSYYVHDDVAIALQEYQISKIYAVVKQKTIYCLLRHEKALENKCPLKSVASTPHTLRIHRDWITKNKLNEIEVPAGSIEAGRLLSDEILNFDTGVIGCINITTVYPNLKVVKKDFNNEKTFDIYALVKVKKRAKKKDLSNVKAEINLLLKKQTPNNIISSNDSFTLHSKE